MERETCECVCHQVGLFGLNCCECTRKALDEFVNGKQSEPVAPEAPPSTAPTQEAGTSEGTTPNPATINPARTQPPFHFEKDEDIETLRVRLAEVERERDMALNSALQDHDEVLKLAARVEELEKAIRHIPIDLKCPASHFRATGCIGDKCKACGLPMVPVNNDLRAALQHGGEEKR